MCCTRDCFSRQQAPEKVDNTRKKKETLPKTKKNTHTRVQTAPPVHNSRPQHFRGLGHVNKRSAEISTAKPMQSPCGHTRQRKDDRIRGPKRRDTSVVGQPYHVSCVCVHTLERRLMYAGNTKAIITVKQPVVTGQQEGITGTCAWTTGGSFDKSEENQRYSWPYFRSAGTRNGYTLGGRVDNKHSKVSLSSEPSQH